MPLPIKDFYAYEVRKSVAGGAFTGQLLDSGGSSLTEDPHTYPEEKDQLSQTTARARCLAEVGKWQSRGFDVGGRVYAVLRGEGAVDPVYDIAGQTGLAGQEGLLTLGVVIMTDKVDKLEKGVRERINLANKEKTAANSVPANGQQPQGPGAPGV